MFKKKSILAARRCPGNFYVVTLFFVTLAFVIVGCDKSHYTQLSQSTFLFESEDGVFSILVDRFATDSIGAKQIDGGAQIVDHLQTVANKAGVCIYGKMGLPHRPVKFFIIDVSVKPQEVETTAFDDYETWRSMLNDRFHVNPLADRPPK